MAHVISDECISCGSCQPECPVDAISEGADKYERSEVCIVRRRAEVCPVEAISGDEE